MPEFAVPSAALRSVSDEFMNILPQSYLEPPVCLHEDAQGENACICRFFAVFMAFADIGLDMER